MAILDAQGSVLPTNTENTKVHFELEQTEQVLKFAIELTKAIQSSLEDDKLNFSDLPNFIPAFTAMIPAITDIDEVMVELGAATHEDADQLKQYVKDELDMTDKKAEDFIENAFGVALDVYIMVRDYTKKSEPVVQEDKISPGSDATTEAKETPA